MKMDFIQSTYLQEIQIHKEIVINQVLPKFFVTMLLDQ